MQSCRYVSVGFSRRNMIQYTAYLFSIIFNYSFMAGFDNCFVGCLFLVTNIELFVHFWSKTRPQKVQLFVETGLKTEGMQAAAYAACIVSLIKNLEELQVSLADVEELVKLIKNISRAIPKHLGPTTKQRPADFKSLSLDKLNKLSKKVDHETFGTLGNAFAILFVEVFEVGTLDVRDWQSIDHWTGLWWLKGVGFKPKELVQFGLTLQELQSAGFTAEDGLTAWQLRESGLKFSCLHNAGFSLQELKDAGFRVQQLAEAGLKLQQLELRGLQAAFQKLLDGGFPPEDLGWRRFQ